MCWARKWKTEGGLGYDNICCPCKYVSCEAEEVMDEFKWKMDDEQLARLPEYLTTYDGCYCKNHLKQDFFMPGGWWLGKVYEARPEKPVLPKGSFKLGYEADGGKEHFWMYGPSGEKNERISNRNLSKKKPVKKKPVKKKTKEVVEETEQERLAAAAEKVAQREATVDHYRHICKPEQDGARGSLRREQRREMLWRRGQRRHEQEALALHLACRR